jgi:enediyne biosynthesis protein E4
MSRRLPTAPLLYALLALPACGEAPRPLLERAECGAEISLQSGSRGAGETLLDLHGNGLALLDIDGDGDLDLLLVDGNTRARLLAGRQVQHHLLVNVGVRDGAPRFEYVPGDTGLRMNGWPTGVATGDVDNDGHVDVLIGGFGEDALFLNRTPAGGAPHFVRRELPGHLSARDWTTSVALADADGDGDLDAYLARYVDVDPAAPPLDAAGEPCLWHGHRVPCGPGGLPAQPDVLLLGDGAGGFTDASDTSGIRAMLPAPALSVLFADLDDDGWPDLYVVNDGQPNTLLVNRGDGNFADRSTLAADATTKDPRPGAGADVGDFDRDGDFDLLVGGYPGEGPCLLREDGGLLYREASPELAAMAATGPTYAWGLHLADFDADGWLDISASNGNPFMAADLPGTGTRWRQPAELYLGLPDRGLPDRGLLDRGLPGGRFGPNTFPDRTPRAGRASARGDLDGDGDLDLVMLTLDGTPRVYVNRTDAPERQMLVTLHDPRGSVVGAALKLRLDDGARIAQVVSSRGFQAASDPRLHLSGTGPVRAASVRWSGGEVEDLDPAALPFGRQLVVRRGQGVVSSRPLGAVPLP